MAIAFIQSAGINANSGTTLAKAYTSNLTANSYLLAFVLSNNGATAPTATVGDSAGNVWTQVAFHDYGGTASKVYIFGAPNIKGAVADTVTATFSGAVTLAVLGILEYSGVFNASAIDIVNQSFLDSITTAYTGASVTTTRVNDVVLGFGYSGNGGASVTPGTNQTVRLNVSATFAIDQPAATIGSYAPSFTSASFEYALGTIALASVSAAYSSPDDRTFGSFPNLGHNVAGTVVYDMASQSSYTAPVDSRVAAIKPVDSRVGTNIPTNSRTPGTYGPGN